MAVAPKRTRWWVEAMVIVWLCWVYDAVANLAPLRADQAFSDASRILHLEAAVHLDPEASLDHWLSAHHALAVFVSNYYDNSHFVVTLGLVGWIWWKAPVIYRPLRNGLVLINLIGMTVFWLFPTAPPRLFDPSTFADVVAQTHAFGSWHSGVLSHAANQFAAMPSLHISWAMWSALAAWRLWGGRRMALLVWLYPAVTAVAVMSTGNHYLLDVVGGAATFVVAMFVADRWSGWWTAREARRSLLGAKEVGAAGSEPAAART